jgi:hypothetical protein
MVRAAHPPLDQVGEGEGLQDLAHGREPRLGPDDADRVVLADVLAGDLGEDVGGGDRASSLSAFRRTSFTMYRPCAPKNMSRSYCSSGQARVMTAFFFTSSTVKVKPSCIVGSMTNPGVLKASAKIL